VALIFAPPLTEYGVTLTEYLSDSAARDWPLRVSEGVRFASAVAALEDGLNAFGTSHSPEPGLYGEGFRGVTVSNALPLPPTGAGEQVPCGRGGDAMVS
jgi:hypothetical protein